MCSVFVEALCIAVWYVYNLMEGFTEQRLQLGFCICICSRWTPRLRLVCEGVLMRRARVFLDLARFVQAVLASRTARTVYPV